MLESNKGSHRSYRVVHQLLNKILLKFVNCSTIAELPLHLFLRYRYSRSLFIQGFNWALKAARKKTKLNALADAR